MPTGKNPAAGERVIQAATVQSDRNYLSATKNILLIFVVGSFAMIMKGDRVYFAVADWWEGFAGFP